MKPSSGFSQDTRFAGAVHLRHRAEHLAARLPALPVSTRRIAASVAPGEHGRRRQGPGESFWQYRRYQFGDPARLVDWRRSARGDLFYVREREWEAAQSVWLWCDRSPSMDFSSSDDWESKSSRAVLLTLALAVLLVGAGERIALLGYDDAPMGGGAALDRLTAHFTVEQQEKQPGAGQENPSLPPLLGLPSHSHLVMVGDFLSTIAEWEDVMRRHAWRGARGNLLQINDPAEEDLPFDGRTRFVGPEAEGELIVGRPQDLRQAYQARFLARREFLNSVCGQLGWTFAHHGTDRPAQSALLALYGAVAGQVI